MTVMDRIKSHRIVPVVRMDDREKALPLAEALLTGGLPIAEITLRTPAAIDVISAITRTFPRMLVGAGTVSTVGQVEAVFDAGARFVMSPGINPVVVAHCLDIGMPVILGVCTPTEIETAIAMGLETLKFFPAAAVGGVPMLKALSGPYDDLEFLPTGGISANTLADYLALPNVIACGGSWMVAEELIAEGDFAEIEALTRDAVGRAVPAPILERVA